MESVNNMDLNKCSIVECMKYGDKQKHKITSRIYEEVCYATKVQKHKQSGDYLLKDINFESKVTEKMFPSGKQLRPTHNCHTIFICLQNSKIQAYFLTNEDLKSEIRNNPSLTHGVLESKDEDYINKKIDDPTFLWSLSRHAGNIHEWDKYLIDVGDILSKCPCDVTDEDRLYVYEKMKEKIHGHTLSIEECAKITGRQKDIMDDIL